MKYTFVWFCNTVITGWLCSVVLFFLLTVVLINSLTVALVTANNEHVVLCLGKYCCVYSYYKLLFLFHNDFVFVCCSIRSDRYMSIN